MKNFAYDKEDVIATTGKLAEYFKDQKIPKPLAWVAMKMLSEMIEADFNGIAVVPFKLKDDETH